MQVVVDSLLVNYQKVGRGPLVVCLPGWGDGARSFKPLASRLADNYTLIALDLPGFDGQSLSSAWGLADFARFIEAFLAKVKARNVYAIIGHSNGGAIAIRGLADNSLQCSKLVLLSSAGVRHARAGRKLLLNAISKAGKMITAPLPAATKHTLRSKYYDKIGSDYLFLPHLQETFKLVVNEDVRSAAATVNIPALLVYGEHDTDTPPLQGRLLAEALTNARLEVIDGAGHFVHQEQTETVAELINEFLEKNV